jgi:hypothetical protein
MNPISVKIEVEGTWCNQWPCLRIEGNNSIYFDGEIVGNKIINFVIPANDYNQLTLCHYGKRFGENNIWDTRINEHNVIIEDRAIKLVGLEFDQVNIIEYLLTHCYFVTESGDIVKTHYFGFNGSLIINFTAPVYEWIITQLVRPRVNKTQDFILETSHSDLFDYRNDLRELKEIEHLLEKHAHLFNKSSQI